VRTPGYGRASSYALAVILAFDWASWYGVLLGVAGAIATFGGAIVIILGVWRWGWRRVHPSPLPAPDVVLGHPGAQISTTPLSELKDGEHRRLVSVKPMYLIENKDPARSMRDVITGARTRDGSESHTFAEFQAPLIGAGEIVQFTARDSLPPPWFADVHESVAQFAFVYWVQFSDVDGVRWEVVYDPEKRACESSTI
jgi:hypothetical protein